MKKLLCVTFLLAGISNMQAMERTKIITLPDAATLEKKLEPIGVQHFLELTQLHKQLGSRRRTHSRIIFTVESAIRNYIKIINLKDPIIPKLMEIKKPMILSVLFGETPYAVEQNGLTVFIK